MIRTRKLDIRKAADLLDAAPARRPLDFGHVPTIDELAAGAQFQTADPATMDALAAIGERARKAVK